MSKREFTSRKCASQESQQEKQEFLLQVPVTSGLKRCSVGYQQCTGVKDDIQKPRYVHNMRT